MYFETKAQLRKLRLSPRKIRLVVDTIKGLPVDEALKQLQFSSKHAAKPIITLLNSAIANATHNYQAERETLIIKNAYVDGGSILYRWLPRAMGRATPIRKRTAHITIILSGEAEEAKLSHKKKAAEEKSQEI